MVLVMTPPRVVIVGGGFGGLNVARALGSLATIGRSAAVADFGSVKLSGGWHGYPGCCCI